MVSEGMREGGMGGGGGEVEQPPGSERFRGWVLALAQDPVEAANTLMTHSGTNNYVLIRADRVDRDDMNLIVPVAATSMEGLNNALTTVRTDTGDPNAILARVTRHRPGPHNGHDEVFAADEGIEGNNAWG